MRLFTYQVPTVWDIIKKEGIYSPTDLKNKCSFLKDCQNDSHGFLQSYDWLKKEMIKKGITSIGEPNDLIWAWDKKNSHNSANLRYKENRKSYNNFVFIELEIPEDRICATSFDLWHNILNNGPIYLGDEEEEYEKLRNDPNLKIDSWQQVFNTNSYDIVFIQYTFFQILMSDIISVKKIDNLKTKTIYKK